MLPIWNTYSFFTTYANIDGWEKDETEITFVRHGATINNIEGKINGGGTNSPLHEEGILQSKERGKYFRANGVKFDVIITTPLIRTKETAEHIASEIGFDGIWDEFADLGEQNMGEFE